MTNLRDMNDRMNQWMGEKPSFNNEETLRLNTNDLVIFQFVANGDDGDRFIKTYRSHIIPQISAKTGKRYNTDRYCPQRSGEAVECPFCTQGIGDIKERMSMWFYVMYILHAQLPQNTSFPQVSYEGNFYFAEEVNAWKRWDTSAWRESPWNDICQLYEMYHGLHNFTAQMKCTGVGLATRFKVYALPNSAGLPPELYQRAAVECDPIMNMLHGQLQQAVQVAPQQQAPGTFSANPSPIGFTSPFSVPGTPPPSVPGIMIPTNSAPPASQASTPVQFTPTPVNAPAPTQTISIPTNNAPPVQQEIVQAPAEPLVTPGPVMTPAPAQQPVVSEEQKRPMRSLF